MHVTICSAGPSLLATLAKYPPPPGPRIAVNRAAYKASCDWLVAGDMLMFQEAKQHVLEAFSGICVPAPTAQLLLIPPLPRFLRKGPRLTPWESLPGYGTAWRRPGMFEGFSLTAAIALAAHLCPEIVHIYGHDQTVGPDCNGVDADGHTPDRWAREADEQASLLRALRLNTVRYSLTSADHHVFLHHVS